MESWRMRMAMVLTIILTMALCVSLAAGARAGSALDAVRGRGHLTCGIAGNQPGLSLVDARGAVVGLEADICRAVAAAIFGGPEKIAFRKIATIADFLDAPDIDMVVHGLTWTFAREGNLGVRFGPVVFYDGQALLTRTSTGLAALPDLAGREVCARTGGEIIGNLQRAFADRNLPIRIHALATRTDAEEAFFAGRCEALTADATELAAALLIRPKVAGDYRLLPERLSKEPLAPLLRRGDDELFDIVRWAVFALIEAEELGVTSATVGTDGDGGHSAVRAFHAAASQRLGLSPGWSSSVVRAVGNYGEIYARHFGPDTPARMDRGQNALWSDGGLMFAPPIR
jgi:general L-amino acid transport system substrate-binding protein